MEKEMINREWVDSLSIFERDLLKAYLDIGRDRTDGTAPMIDEALKIKECVHCRSHKIICYGHSAKGRQRYLCKDCRRTFTIVTKSFFRNSRISYETWLKLLECELLGLSLKETSYQIGLSVTSCFYLRHKIYKTIEDVQSRHLSGNVQLDTTFLDIGFKGFRITPRPVKGSRKNPKADILFDKDPQICISTAADENGEILFLSPAMEANPQRSMNCISTVTIKAAGSLIRYP